MSTEWKVYARDNRTLQRMGEIDDYRSLEIIPRFNAVGSWQLELHRTVPLAVEMTQPWFGIEVVRRFGVTEQWQTVLSGPVNTRMHKRDTGTNHVTISGFTDDVWLRDRVASPAPLESFPPYTTAEYHVVTGVASTVLRTYADVNAGPSAIGPRRVPRLTGLADPLIGTTVNERARWVNLLELLQGVAIKGGNLGFHVRQSGQQLLFDVFQPVDRTATIRFSVELGNLESFEYESARPESNYVFVGGGGEGTARTIKEVSDAGALATWGRIEQFVDQRQTTDATELQQAADEHLAENGEKAGLSITPVDLDGQRYGEHYDLGDKVTVMVDGVPVQEIVREVKISLTPDGQTVQPALGTPGRQVIFSIFRRYRDLARKVSNLERR